MSDDPRKRKRALRRQVVARVTAMDPLERARQESALFAYFMSLPGLDKSKTVLLYVSAFPEEFDTFPYLSAMLQSGRRVACPRVDRLENRLKLFVVEDLARDLAPGALRIPEPISTRPEIDPIEIDWALVPGIAFDLAAFRLGRGAGHYDRLLPLLRPDIHRWALALEPQWVDLLPNEAHDQPLTGVVSESRIVQPSHMSKSSRL